MRGMFTKAELREYLREQWAERGCELSDGQRMGVSVEELVQHSVERNFKTESPYVDLWVKVLDEFISWFISLEMIFLRERKFRRKLTDFDRSVILLLSKIIGDSTAIRHLILLGFDSAARTLLRSTSEYIEVLVAVLSEPTLATAFAKTDTPEGGAKFWKTHLASGGIGKKIYSAWRSLFQGENDREVAQWFSNWGASSGYILSAMIHPSFAGGMLTAIPLKEKYTDEKWLGIWGDKSEWSVETLFIYARYVFPVFLLFRNFPFEGFGQYMSGGDIKYDEKEELHKHIKIGRDVLASLILSLVKETNYPHVFPKFDFTIWDGPKSRRKER
jgi:hypothetical protein